MKIIILVLSIFLLSGCTNQENQLEEPIYKSIDIEEPQYQDNNPITISLYLNNHIVTTDSISLTNFKEFNVYNILFTNEEYLKYANIKDNWNYYYNQYDNIDEYKIGFYISFEVNGTLYEQNALDPESLYTQSPYLYVYLYDDIHQEPNTWYSHLEPEDMQDNTIFSSIKLFLAQEGEKITSPVTLTVFTYKDTSDFDENNHYRGNSKYTITINTY